MNRLVGFVAGCIVCLMLVYGFNILARILGLRAVSISPLINFVSEVISFFF